ncbi:MAG: hypothetical protein ACTSPY_08450 [Candidatus Helarchaeota archaeon]
MTARKKDIWEEMCRIEKLFKKQKGKDTAITIKSIEEYNKKIAIIFSVKVEGNQISIPLSVEEWDELRLFFNNVDRMIKGSENNKKDSIEENINETIQISEYSPSEKNQSEEINSNIDEDAAEILVDIEELTEKEGIKELEDIEIIKETDKLEVEEENIEDAIKEIIRNVQDAIKVGKNKDVEKDIKEIQDKDKKTEKKKSILPNPIKLEELPNAQPVKDIPLPSWFDTKEIEKNEIIKNEVNSKIEVDEAKVPETPEILEISEISKTSKTSEVIEAQENKFQEEELKVKNLEELIEKIVSVNKTDQENIVDSSSELNYYEKNENGENNSNVVQESPEIELQTKLKEILDSPEELSKVSVDEVIYKEQINKSSPRLPRKPQAILQKEQIVNGKQEIGSEERILKAMEITASLLPEGDAKNFILEMKEKRKKIIKPTEEI